MPRISTVQENIESTYIGPALCKGPLPFGRGFCLVALSPIVSLFELVFVLVGKAKIQKILVNQVGMAERVGFEPTIRLPGSDPKRTIFKP
jgi:hypothetical protein